MASICISAGTAFNGLSVENVECFTISSVLFLIVSRVDLLRVSLVFCVEDFLFLKKYNKIRTTIKTDNMRIMVSIVKSANIFAITQMSIYIIA